MPERPPGKSGPWPERKIRPPRPDVAARRRPKAGEPAYAELHCHTNFSFLDGASHPEDLVVEAARLGLSGLAVTDHDGLYGAVRFAGVARELGLPTVFGADAPATPPTTVQKMTGAINMRTSLMNASPNGLIATPNEG